MIHIEYHEQYVLDGELWILFVYVHTKHLSCMNFTWMIAQYLCHGAVTAGGTRICCGHLVSRIARNLGLFNPQEMELFGEPVMCKTIEMKSFWHLRDSETRRLTDMPEVLEVEPLGEDRDMQG